MMKLIPSLVVSNTVLNILINDSRFYDLSPGYIELFENCREQGYKIILLKQTNYITICFSKDRGSDDIVVYFNNDYEGRNYSKQFWNNRRYFNSNQYQEVVDYICDLCTNEN